MQPDQKGAMELKYQKRHLKNIVEAFLKTALHYTAGCLIFDTPAHFLLLLKQDDKRLINC